MRMPTVQSNQRIPSKMADWELDAVSKNVDDANPSYWVPKLLAHIKYLELELDTKNKRT